MAWLRVTHMSTDLRDRLRRLGMQKGASHLKTLKPSIEKQAELAAAEYATSATPVDAAMLIGERTALGNAWLRRERYAPAHAHGDLQVVQALQVAQPVLSKLGGRGTTGLDLRDALFVDTETTGLAGGAGTLAFLVGLGWFEGDDFVIEQFFLKDPAHEAAMLAAINRRVASRAALVSFNGKAFDIPLLETRFTLSRIAPPFADKTHLDLLMPARRVWKRWIGSCSLSSLEHHLLGVHRSQQDIAGFLIPQLYREFLNSGRDTLTDEMNRVMYHNLHDVLSMVTLIARLGDVLARPRDAREQFTAAMFHEREGETGDAERLYREAAAQPTHDDTPRQSQQRLAQLYKRQNRADDAVAAWHRLADADDLPALIELAKHYEWRAKDLDQALASALRAWTLASDPTAQRELDVRVKRLQRKRAVQLKK
jgi:uncharacterized protein